MNDLPQASPSYYAIIPASVRYSKDLEPNAKLLYGEITALSTSHGYSWATNAYFAELYDVDIRTVQRWLSSLEKKGFIYLEIENKTFNAQRKIFINDTFQKSFTVGQKCHPPMTKMSPIVLHLVLQRKNNNRGQPLLLFSLRRLSSFFLAY